MDTDKIWTVEDAAKILDKSKKEIYKLAKMCGIKLIQGGEVRVHAQFSDADICSMSVVSSNKIKNLSRIV